MCCAFSSGSVQAHGGKDESVGHQKYELVSKALRRCSVFLDFEDITETLLCCTSRSRCSVRRLVEARHGGSRRSATLAGLRRSNHSRRFWAGASKHVIYDKIYHIHPCILELSIYNCHIKHATQYWYLGSFLFLVLIGWWLWLHCRLHRLTTPGSVFSEQATSTSRFPLSLEKTRAMRSAINVAK